MEELQNQLKVLSEDFAKAVISDARKLNPIPFERIYVYNASDDELSKIASGMGEYFRVEREKLKNGNDPNLRRVLDYLFVRCQVLSSKSEPNGTERSYSFNVGLARDIYARPGGRLVF